MTETLLISQTDLQDVKAIPASVTFNRLAPYILQAQWFDIREQLGDVFYTDMMLNYSSTPYNTLLRGGQYSDANSNVINFLGMYYAICYYAYSKFILNQQIAVTSFGVVQKTNEFSQGIDSKTIALQANQSILSGDALMNDVKKYLDMNTTLFPLWSAQSCNQKRSPVNGFTRVSRV